MAQIIIAFILLAIGIKDKHHLTIWIALLLIIEEFNSNIFSKRSSKIRNEK